MDEDGWHHEIPNENREVVEKFSLKARTDYYEQPLPCESMILCINLCIVDLTHLNLTNLPEIFGQLKLKKLFLAYNNFDHIPNAVLNIETLEYLCLSDNQILEIPNRINRLKNLQTLSLSSNNITEISGAISNMPELINLNLNYNRNLMNISPCIVHNHKLRSLNLIGIGMINPPSIDDLKRMNRLLIESTLNDDETPILPIVLIDICADYLI